MKVNLALLFVIVLITSSLSSQSQEISIKINAPTLFQVTDSILVIQCTVTSTFEVKEVSASVGNSKTMLAFNAVTLQLEGALSLANQHQDTLILVVSATDINDVTKIETVDFIYDAKPVLRIIEPATWDVADPFLKFTASCSDKGEPCQIKVGRILKAHNILPLAEGIHMLDTILDLSYGQGTSISVKIDVIDSRHTITAYKRLYVESSPYIKLLAEFDAPIVDLKGSEVLTLHSIYEDDGVVTEEEISTIKLEIHNVETGITEIIPFPGEDIHSAFFGDSTVIFNTMFPSEFFSWNGSELSSISEPVADINDTYGTNPQTLNGFTAFTKMGSLGQDHIWLKYPDGTELQITNFGSSAVLELLNPLGEIVYSNNGIRYLYNTSGKHLAASSAIGKVYWDNDSWLITIGNRVYQIDREEIALHTIDDVIKTSKDNAIVAFSKSDFTQAYAGAGTLTKIVLKNLPEHGSLKLYESFITEQHIPYEMSQSDLNYFTYLPEQDFQGQDNITYNASNGVRYSENTANIILNVERSTITSLDEVSADDHIALYPNPSNGEVLVELSAERSRELLSMIILDAVGRECSIQSQSNEPNLFTFDVAPLPTGTYYVKMNFMKGYRVLRFVVF